MKKMTSDEANRLIDEHFKPKQEVIEHSYRIRDFDKTLVIEPIKFKEEYEREDSVYIHWYGEKQSLFTRLKNWFKSLIIR